MYELITPEEVNQFLERFPTNAIFKAGACHKTMQGFGYVEEALSKREGLEMGLIRVIESRSASNHVAAITGIGHESPQFILFVEGEPKFDVDNWAITLDVVESALHQHLGPAGDRGRIASSDLSGYTDLLEKFIGNTLIEEEFEASWKTMFRNDASLRSTREFELINGLYADRSLLGVAGKRPGLYERASDLLKVLHTSR